MNIKTGQNLESIPRNKIGMPRDQLIMHRGGIFRDVAIAEWRSRSMTEVPSLAYRIKHARRHIEVGRVLIERQKEMVERHRLEGRDTKPAQDLLTALENSQEVFERDLTRLELMEK
jgi:hypothetical protein